MNDDTHRHFSNKSIIQNTTQYQHEKFLSFPFNYFTTYNISFKNPPNYSITPSPLVLRLFRKKSHTPVRYAPLKPNTKIVIQGRY